MFEGATQKQRASKETCCGEFCRAQKSKCDFMRVANFVCDCRLITCCLIAHMPVRAAFPRREVDGPTLLKPHNGFEVSMS